jgi:hypothetical protein
MQHDYRVFTPRKQDDGALEARRHLTNNGDGLVFETGDSWTHF